MRSACILKKVKKLLTENTFNKYDRYHFKIAYSVSKEETKLIYSVHGAIQIVANPLIKTIFENENLDVDERYVRLFSKIENLNWNEISKSDSHAEFVGRADRASGMQVPLLPRMNSFKIPGSRESYLLGFVGLPKRPNLNQVHSTIDKAISCLRKNKLI